MCYTTKQLQGMSDFEVNKALAEKLRVYWHAAPAVTKNNTWEYAPHYAECKTESGEVAVHLPDYCNNPNDIMPLAFERGISLIRVIDGYVAIKYDLYIDIGSHEDIQGICADGPQFGDTNPLRAIACLILMME